MRHHFHSHQSSEAEQHMKKALLFHRPTYKWAWICPEYWSAFLRAKINSERHRMSLLWDNKNTPGDTWASRAGQLCSTARPAPLLAAERCLLLFCWEVSGPFREYTWFAPNSTPSTSPAKPSPLTLVPCVVYLGSDLVLPSVSPGWLAIKKKRKKKKKRKERALCDFLRY